MPSLRGKRLGARRENRGQQDTKRPRRSVRDLRTPRRMFVSQTAAERLEEGVAPEQRAKNRAQLDIGEVICGSDRCSRDGDVHAIQECDGAKNEQPEDKEPTKGARLLAGHLWSFALQPLLE